MAQAMHEAGADAIGAAASNRHVQRAAERAGFDAEAALMDVVRVIGGAMIGIAVLVVVLNEVFSLEVIANDSGSFTGVIDSLETTGGAALGLLVIGLLVAAANRVMGFFGGGGF